LNPEALLEGPDDPIAGLLNQARVDLSAYVLSGGELKSRKEQASGEPPFADAKPDARGNGAPGPDFSKLAALAGEIGLQGLADGVVEVVLAAGELVEKALTAVELLELKALENKLAIEVELQGMIAQQVRGGHTAAATSATYKQALPHPLLINRRGLILATSATYNRRGNLPATSATY
jgi:hypothetical protein